MDRKTEKFVNAVKAMEKRIRNVRAFVVINPDNSQHNGRYVISYPKDGVGRCYAIAWLPGQHEETHRHHGHASGGGYDKATAATGGAEFWNLKEAKLDRLVDQGYSHRQQLEQAGWIVIQAC